MRQSIAELADGAVDVTLLAERWVRSNPGLRITWLENWITQRVHIGARSLCFASNCGTDPLACRFT